MDEKNIYQRGGIPKRHCRVCWEEMVRDPCGEGLDIHRCTKCNIVYRIDDTGTYLRVKHTFETAKYFSGINKNPAGKKFDKKGRLRILCPICDNWIYGGSGKIAVKICRHCGTNIDRNLPVK